MHQVEQNTTSALTDHATQENHVINWSQATVIDREPERLLPKSKRPSTFTGRNVRLSNLLSSCKYRFKNVVIRLKNRGYANSQHIYQVSNGSSAGVVSVNFGSFQVCLPVLYVYSCPSCSLVVLLYFICTSSSRAQFLIIVS